METVEEPEQMEGAARLPLRDVLFCLTYKVLYQRSYRRTVIELRRAAEQGLISRVPSCFSARQVHDGPGHDARTEGIDRHKLLADGGSGVRLCSGLCGIRRFSASQSQPKRS